MLVVIAELRLTGCSSVKFHGLVKKKGEITPHRLARQLTLDLSAFVQEIVHHIDWFVSVNEHK